MTDVEIFFWALAAFLLGVFVGPLVVYFLFKETFDD